MSTFYRLRFQIPNGISLPILGRIPTTQLGPFRELQHLNILRMGVHPRSEQLQSYFLVPYLPYRNLFHATWTKDNHPLRVSLLAVNTEPSLSILEEGHFITQTAQLYRLDLNQEEDALGLLEITHTSRSGTNIASFPHLFRIAYESTQAGSTGGVSHTLFAMALARAGHYAIVDFPYSEGITPYLSARLNAKRSTNLIPGTSSVFFNQRQWLLPVTAPLSTFVTGTNVLGANLGGTFEDWNRLKYHNTFASLDPLDPDPIETRWIIDCPVLDNYIQYHEEIPFVDIPNRVRYYPILSTNLDIGSSERLVSRHQVRDLSILIEDSKRYHPLAGCFELAAFENSIIQIDSSEIPNHYRDPYRLTFDTFIAGDSNLSRSSGLGNRLTLNPKRTLEDIPYTAPTLNPTSHTLKQNPGISPAFLFGTPSYLAGAYPFSSRNLYTTIRKNEPIYFQGQAVKGFNIEQLDFSPIISDIIEGDSSQPNPAPPGTILASSVLSEFTGQLYRNASYGDEFLLTGWLKDRINIIPYNSIQYEDNTTTDIRDLYRTQTAGDAITDKKYTLVNDISNELDLLFRLIHFTNYPANFGTVEITNPGGGFKSIQLISISGNLDITIKQDIEFTRFTGNVFTPIEYFLIEAMTRQLWTPIL